MCPEGSSETERHLRPIKTGCGRIAMGTEKANNFGLGLRILPVGLTYKDGQKFRDEVVVNFGKMIQKMTERCAIEGEEVSTLNVSHPIFVDRPEMNSQYQNHQCLN